MSWSFDQVDLSGVDTDGGRATLRPGNHEVKIANAEIKTTNAGNGKYVEVRLEGENGQYVIDRINVHNPNKKATEIGLARLKSLLTFAGHPSPDKPGDIKSLLGLKVGVRVEQGESWQDKDGNVRPGGGQPRNNGAYFALDGTVELGEVEAPQMAAPSKPASSGSMPDDSIPF